MARAPEVVRELSEGVALRAAVTGRPVALDRVPEGGERFRILVGEVARVRAPLEQSGSFRRRESDSGTQSPLELICGFAMRAGGRGPVPGDRREAQHGFRVARCLRVMGEPRRVGVLASGRFERGERAPVEIGASVGGERALDREPRQLVPEEDDVAVGEKHPGGEAFLHGADAARDDRLEDRVLGMRRDGGDGLEQLRRLWAQSGGAREHRIPGGLWYLGAVGGEHLGDEKGVAVRLAVEVFGVHAVRLGERGNRVRRERLDGEASRAVAVVELAERAAERVAPVELVVAVGGDYEGGERLDAPRDDSQYVEGRLVRPVHVLDHDDGRFDAFQLAHHRGRDLVWLDAAGRGPLEIAAGCVSDVEERAERPRGVERVARASKDPGGRGVRGEAAHERRLADAGLATDEHEAAASGGADVFEQAGECRERAAALEQFRSPLADLRGGHGLGPRDHEAMIPAQPRRFKG